MLLPSSCDALRRSARGEAPVVTASANQRQLETASHHRFGADAQHCGVQEQGGPRIERPRTPVLNAKGIWTLQQAPLHWTVLGRRRIIACCSPVPGGAETTWRLSPSNRSVQMISCQGLVFKHLGKLQDSSRHQNTSGQGCKLNVAVQHAQSIRTVEHHALYRSLTCATAKD